METVMVIHIMAILRQCDFTTILSLKSANRSFNHLIIDNQKLLLNAMSSRPSLQIHAYRPPSTGLPAIPFHSTRQISTTANAISPRRTQMPKPSICHRLANKLLDICLD